MPNPTAITDGEITGMLKNLYSNIRLKLQNISTPLVSQLKKVSAGGAQSMRWGGSDLFWSVKVGRPAGGSFSSVGFFPPDTTALERQARVGVKRAYVTRMIDGLALVGTQTKAMAFETILSKTYDEIKSALFLLQQGAFHNKPDGVLALTNTTMASALPLVVAYPYGLGTAGTIATSTGQGGLLLSPGDYVAILDTSAADAVIGRATIGSITHSGDLATITFVSPGITGFATVAAGDKLVRATASDTSFGFATNGLINIMNRGAAYGLLHDINPATAGNEIWNTVRMTAGTDTPDASSPSEDDLWILAQRISGLSGKSPLTNPDQWLLLTTPGIQQKLIQNLASLRRFDAASFTKKVNGGYNAVSISGMDCIADYYVPNGTVYLIHKPSLALVDGKDAGYVEFEGAGPWRWVTGRDAFETTYSWYGELATLQRNAHGMITGYTDTARYSHIV